MKHNKQIKFYLTALCIISLLTMFACGYKAATPHNYTEDELAAAETTRELKAEKETKEETELTTEMAMEEEEDAELVIADSFITEMPDVYEDYKAPETEPEEAEEEVYTTPDKWEDGHYNFDSDEIWEMTRVVYLENGITWPECSYNTVYLTACVILNRLYDWEECSTVYDVIWQGGQYSTADRYHDYNGSDLGSSNPEGWEISVTAVWDAIENCDRHPHFQSMGPQGEVYYVDPTTGETFCY